MHIPLICIDRILTFGDDMGAALDAFQLCMRQGLKFLQYLLNMCLLYVKIYKDYPCCMQGIQNF